MAPPPEPAGPTAGPARPTTGRRARIALALSVTAAATGLGGASPSAADHVPCPTAGQVRENGRWVRVGAPPYRPDEGPAGITAFAAAPYSRRVLFATNGRTVKASIDSGCSWDPVFADVGSTGGLLPQLEVGYQPPRLTHLALPDGPGHRLWVVGQESVAGVVRTRVWASEDARPAPGGVREPFVAYDEGLPLAGTPVAFGVASARVPSAPAYVLVRVPVRIGTGEPEQDVTRLYRRDQGVWVEVELPPGMARPAGLHVDAGGTARLWAGAVWAEIRHDANSWTAYELPARTVNLVHAVRFGPRLAVRVWHGDVEGGAVTTYDGEREQTRPAPNGVTVAAAAIPPAEVSAVTGDLGTFGWDVRARIWVPLLPAPSVRLQSLTLTRDSVQLPVLYGATADAIWRFDLYLGGRFLPDGPEPPPPPDTDDGPAGPPRRNRGRLDFTVPVREVTLRPGVPHDVPVSLSTAGRPAVLDVFFLVDTTSSMTSYIEGLRRGMRGVVRELDRLGVDAAFGVGDVKDLDAKDTNDRDALQAYRLKSAITKDRSQVDAALGSLRAVALPNKDIPEAQTVGLHYLLDPGGAPLRVAPGQHARFRPGALKVVMLLSDASFHQQKPEYFTIDEVVADLVGAGVRFVGIRAKTRNAGEPGNPIEDQRRVAAGTKSFAPPGGVDCDGDDVPDLAVGEPLVCEVDLDGALNLSAPVLSLLRGLRELGRVAITLRGDVGVVARQVGMFDGVFDLREPQQLGGVVTLLCTPEQDGQDFAVGFDGIVGQRVVGTADLVARCRGVPIAPPPPPLVPAKEGGPPLPPVLVNPAPPPQQLPPNSNVNPNPQLNPQTGAAQQREEEFQLATVGQAAPEDDGAVQLAMSRLRQDDPAAAPALVGAVALTLAAGAAAAHARRVRPAPARAVPSGAGPLPAAVQRARSRRSRCSSTRQ